MATSQIKSITPIILLPFVFFIGIPYLVLSSNLADITSLDASLHLTLITLTLLFTAILLLAFWISQSSTVRFCLISLVEPLCFFVMATGYVFPLVISTGMVDPGDAPVHWQNLGFAALSSLLMTWGVNKKGRKLLYTGLLLFVALNLAHSVYKIHSTLNLKVQGRTLYEVSTNRNIFVLSLDGISNSAAIEVLKNNSELAQSFGGFTLFDNAASSSPSTTASLITSLYGNENLKLKFKTMDQVEAGISNGLLSNYLNENGFLVSTFGLYGTGFHHPQQSSWTSLAKSLNVTMLLNFTIARTFTGQLTVSEDLLGNLEGRFERESRPLEESNLLEKIEKAKSPSWKKRFAAEYIDLERYLHNLKVGTNQAVAHFTHFTFTHFPVDFDRDCLYRGDEDQWSKERQNWAGVKEETFCALSKFAQFISRVKELGVFDQSLIVLKSDHGKPVGYYAKDSLFSHKIHGHKVLGFGRYEPFLAIKNFGPQSGPLKKNTSPVLLDDMARTICMAALEATRCDQYPGLDLLAQNPDLRASPKVTIFITASKASNWKFGTWKAITINRHPDIRQNLHEHLTKKKANEE